MTYTLDLHTHSTGSPDGSLRTRDYRRKLESGALDYIAITDHNRIDAALEIQSQLGELGARIIIGEEINTIEGEIIGLYLEKQITAGKSVKKTVELIRKQGGLVYVPHPFETVRSGLPSTALDIIADEVDIVEAYNGRAVFQDKGRLAERWAIRHGARVAASSDAHGRRGWGKTYTVVDEPPTKANLRRLLKQATQGRRRVGIGIVYPKLNRVRNISKRP